MIGAGASHQRIKIAAKDAAVTAQTKPGITKGCLVTFLLLISRPGRPQPFPKGLDRMSDDEVDKGRGRGSGLYVQRSHSLCGEQSHIEGKRHHTPPSNGPVLPATIEAAVRSCALVTFDDTWGKWSWECVHPSASQALTANEAGLSHGLVVAH